MPEALLVILGFLLAVACLAGVVEMVRRSWRDAAECYRFIRDGGFMCCPAPPARETIAPPETEKAKRWREMEQEITDEIVGACAAGQDWTDWREFLCDEEAMAADPTCGLRFRGEACDRPAVVVRYSTLCNARIACCLECLRRIRNAMEEYEC